MGTLYARRNAVFEPILSGGVCINPNQGCILDMRLHWTSNTTATLPAATKDLLENSGGASIITDFSWSSGTSGGSCTVGFAAKHPSLDIYYSTYITRTAYGTEYEPYMLKEDKVYAYNAATGVLEPYYVLVDSYAGRNIQSPLVWTGGYILMDLDINTNAGLVPGTRIEPFNVIFDPTPDPNNDSPQFIWEETTGRSALPMSGNIFTNSPVVTGGGLVTPSCNIELHGNSISFIRNKNTNISVTAGIRAINNVTPVNGNINITIL